MCDTMVAPSGSTVGHFVLFGKNSDRQRNEAQMVEYFPAADHQPHSQLACTYIAIPQAQHTHAVLICRPFWMWGAEMGANEHGVVIGNEGLHARSPASEEKALTGMDLLRLALERASTAAEAVQVMTTLLAQHGQGGNCGHLTPSHYLNGYIVADASEAFVLETVGREWLVEQVRGVRSISNRYSIGRDPLRVSAGLPRLVRESGWSNEAYPNYAEVIANPNREHIGNASARQACSTALLTAHEGRLTAADMMSILRTHGDGAGFHPQWHAECTVVRTLCMHAGAHDKPGQAVGSLVSELHRTDAVHWVTGTAAPCISIFKPVLLDVPLPSHGPRLTDNFDPHALWWRHERLHRAALRGDFAQFLADIRAERDALEAVFGTRVQAVLNSGSAAERTRVVAECWSEAMQVEDGWHRSLGTTAAPDSLCMLAWDEMNRLAGVELPAAASAVPRRS